MHRRLNAYKIMWLFVFFDLPVVTKKQRKRAQDFRKLLLRYGFTMMQYSVYIRHCASKQSMEVYIKQVEVNIPEDGQVSILSVTDKQYGMIMNFFGMKKEQMQKAPQQLELF